MATKTTNYNLAKPSYSENADISVINSNMDIIDSKMKEIEDKAGTGGGGSNVEWNQIQTSGTKIAEVTIDGTMTEVYAPSESGGGGDIESEVIDIRLKADGTTATSAGNAVREQVSELKSDLVNLKTERKGRILFDYLENGFIYWKTGVVVDNESVKHTDFISVVGKSKIGVSRGNIQFAFYDSAKNYVDGVLIDTSGHDYEMYDIPQNASYVRLSVDNNYIGKAYYTLSNNEFPFDDYLIIHDDPSKCPDFQTVRKGVEFAVQFKNAKVFIKRAIYNLLNDFSEEINSSKIGQYGLPLGNGIHIIGESGAIINCLYTGTDSNVHTYLSPFYVLSTGGGFTLENVEIHSSNCRYCVHDELAGLDVVSIHKYINCRMYHDNTGAGSLANYYITCIGGGCGLHTYVEIDGCYFWGKKAETDDMTPLVAYHNCNEQMGQSFINVKNCYFDNKGTFRATWYGNSTYKSYATLCGNSFGSYPWTQSEGGATTENMFIRKYLNEVRSS